MNIKRYQGVADTRDDLDNGVAMLEEEDGEYVRFEDYQALLTEQMKLWCAVYDGPIAWRGRSAFEQIDHLESLLEK